MNFGLAFVFVKGHTTSTSTSTLLLPSLTGLIYNNNYGLASSCWLFQPSGICSEFNKVVYLCDTQASRIKVFTTLENTAEFLRGVGELFSAFSIHEKHQAYDLCDLETAISRVSRCLQVLQENERSIRELNISLPQSLNGSQGSVQRRR